MSAAETWVPIFEKDGHELFVLMPSFVAECEDDARKIAWGASLVESIVFGLTFRRVQRIDVKNTPHLPGDVGGIPVAIIAGPSFDEQAAQPSEVPA